MENSLEDQLANKYVSVVCDENGSQLKITFLGTDNKKVSFEFQTGCFSNFENFCVFESTLTLTIADLYPYRDPMWKKEYQKNIPEGIGEVFEKVEEDCKKFVVRTVIHCLKENYLDMIEELVQIHQKVHEDVREQMDKQHKV